MQNILQYSIAVTQRILLLIAHRLRSDEVETFAMEMLGGDDDETVVDSSGYDSDGPPRDYVRGLAQRATDPYFKERKAKGPFVVSSMLGAMPVPM